MPPGAGPARWRIVIGGYGPSAMLGGAEGAALAVATVGAGERGASVESAGLAVLCFAAGGLAAALPAAWAVGRVGERGALFASGLIGAAAALSLVFTTDLVAFLIAFTVLGIVASVYKLARQSFLASVLPPHRLGVGMSTLGGVMRVGMVLGPLTVGLVLPGGGLDAASVVVAVLMFAGALVSLCAARTTPVQGAPTVARRGALPVLRAYRRELLRAGPVAVLINLLRSLRPVVVPLWALSIGMDAAQIAFLLAVSGAVELALFLPGGLIMDRWGRAAVAIPAALTLGAAVAALPLTSDHIGLAIVSVLFGVGSGLSSGLIMTMAADIAQPGDRASFLGWWRLLSEAGLLAGPTAVAAGVAVLGLAPALVVFFPVGAVTAACAARALRHPGR